MSTLFPNQLFHYAFLETKNIWDKHWRCLLYLNLTNRKFKAFYDPRVYYAMCFVRLSSQLCWLFEAFDNEKELLYKTLAVQFQCNERVIVPPRLDALTEQISAAAHTIYSKCYTTHAGKNRLMDQGRWNKIEYLYFNHTRY